MPTSAFLNNASRYLYRAINKSSNSVFESNRKRQIQSTIG